MVKEEPSKKMVEPKELSFEDLEINEAKELFKDNPNALGKYFYLKKFSLLTHEQRIAWIKRNNIK